MVEKNELAHIKIYAALDKHFGAMKGEIEKGLHGPKTYFISKFFEK
jgi:small basic protein